MKLVPLVFFLFLSPCLFGQAYLTKDIKSFGAKGDGKTNDQEAFEKAAIYFNTRGGNGKLIISKGIYLIGKQIFNQKTTSKPVYEGSDILGFKNISNLVIEGQTGASLKYAKGLRFGAFDPASGKPFLHGNNSFINPPYVAFIGSAISLTNCKNIQLRNLEINGNNNELILGGIYGDVGIQIPHNGIYIINSSNIVIDKMVVHHFGLDGIQISNNTGDKRESDNVLLQNSSFEYNARQGLSWVSGNELTVVNCKFNHTGRGKFNSAPSSGVDIEAEIGTIRNGKFSKSEFIDNAGCGVVADSGPSSNCTFSDCTFWGVTNWSLWINKPGFKVHHSKIYGSFVHGYNALTEAEATTFKNCLFEDKPYKGQEPFGNFLIETNYKRRVRFDDCTMIAHKKKIIWMESDPSFRPEEKYQLNNCRLVFEGGIDPEGGWVSLTRNIRYKNCTFEMIHPDAKKKNYYFNGIGEKYNVDLGHNKYYVNKVEVKI